MSEAKQKAIVAIDALGLSMESKFVPWSQSRNKAAKELSLNWLVTIKRNGKDVLTTDYMAGSGHSPANKSIVPSAWNRPKQDYKHYAIEYECKHGKKAKFVAGSFMGNGAILPDIADVLYSLSMDSDVLNYSGFEPWASEFGYEADSRKAEAVYRACLDIALQLRGAIGEAGLAALAEAFQDY